MSNIISFKNDIRGPKFNKSLIEFSDKRVVYWYAGVKRQPKNKLHPKIKLSLFGRLLHIFDKIIG